MKKILLSVFMLALFVTVGAKAVLASTTFDVEVEVYTDNSTPQDLPSITGKARGDKVEFASAGLGEGFSFAYYAVNGVIREDLPVDYQFTVRANMSITAVYYPNGSLVAEDQRHVIVLVDSSSKILSVQYVADGLNATDTGLVLPTKPNGVVSEDKWVTSNGVVASLENVISNGVYYLNYEATASADVTLTTVDATGAGTFKANDVATVVALSDKEGVPFSHFEDAKGNVLSTNQTYKFTMVKDTTVTAVYAATKAVGPLVNMTDTLNIRPEHTSYIGQFELAEGYELVEYGFIISRSSDVLTLESLGATVIPSNVHNGTTKEFLRSFTADAFNSIRAYLIVMNNNGKTPVQEVKYSENMVGGLVLSEQVIYQTGFENDENFTSGTTYNNTSPNLQGIVGKQWSFLYGTPSTTSALSGQQSAQMRIYKDNSYRASLTTLFSLNNVKKMVFKASNTGDVNVKVSHSIDNGVTFIPGTVYPLSSTPTEYTYSLIEESSNVVFRLELDSVNTSDTYRLYIDDVKIYGMLMSSLHEVVYDNEGVLTEQWIANNGLVTSAPKKTGYTFSGWFTDAEKTIEHSNAPVVSSLKLYAKFTINEYTVFFDHRGADGGILTPSITAPYGTDITLPVPTKTGYEFDGWKSESGSTTYNSPFTIGSTNNYMFATWIINDLGKTMEDAAELSFPATISEATTLTLETVGTYGSLITWATTNGTVINASSGVVTLPAQTILVTLTATVSLNGKTTVREIEITVNPVGGSEPEVLTDTVVFGNTDSGATSVPSTKNFAILWNDRAPSNLDIFESNIATMTKTYTYANLADNTNKNIKFGNSSAGGANLTINFPNLTIQSVIINAKVYGSDSSVKIVLNEISSPVLTSTSTNYTFDIADANYITITNEGKRFYINSITFTYLVNPA